MLPFCCLRKPLIPELYLRIQHRKRLAQTSHVILQQVISMRQGQFEMRRFFIDHIYS